MTRRIGSGLRAAGVIIAGALPALAFGFAGVASAQARMPPQASRPNIVLIQADDLGYGDLGSYGQSRMETPQLDAMARDGTRFTQYYAGSTVCAPSRASLMTGLHTGHAWIRRNGEIPLRDADTTLGEVLRSAGYRTAVIGKWGLGTPGSSGEPNRQGFDYAYGFLDHRHAHRQYTEHLWRNGARVMTDPDHDYVNDLFTREALGWVGNGDAKPFFLYLNYTVPHPELRVPEDSLAQFRGRFPEKPFRNPRSDAHHALPEGVTLGYRSQATPSAARAAMIARMDADIGRLRALLQREGLADNTLVLFVSDNGPHTEGGQDIAFFDATAGLRGRKRELYEGGIRVPMLAVWPGKVPAGRVSAQVMAHWDWMPTLAALAGAKPPSRTDGHDLSAVLRGGTSQARPPLYWEFPEDGFAQAARSGDWKAVRPPGKPLELYDLSRDPAESHDVAAQQPRQARAMAAFIDGARDDRQGTPPAPQVDAAMSALIDTQLRQAAAQSLELAAHTPADKMPRTFNASTGKLATSGTDWWTSGFYPGTLWMLYGYTRDARLRAEAERRLEVLEKEKHFTGNHDIGFMIFNSFGNAYKLTGDARYRDVIQTAADTATTRYEPAMGAIQSWNASKDFRAPVIIDNLMNLELLLWAAAEGGDARYRDIALRHADTTLAQHYRADCSSVHVVDFNPDTGKVLRKRTWQGAADDSAWARGQGWGLYGYTMLYRLTDAPRYLKQARCIAQFLLDHPRMPADGVPYWDFDAPGIPEAPRDASAGALIASALLELGQYVEGEERTRYVAAAKHTLQSLSAPPYRAEPGSNGGFLLKHSVGSLPHNSEVDVPLTYADYYYVEALLRYRDWYLSP